MDDYDVAKGLEAMSRHVVHCNGYTERMKPWELKKDPANATRVQTVLYHLAESLAHCAILLSPVLPQAAAKITSQLRREDLLSLKLDDLKWGLLADGHEIGKPKPVFPRIVLEDT